MGLTDELEALRQSGRVKANSEKLASSAPLPTPEFEAERLRRKVDMEKRSRSEARDALHNARFSGEEAWQFSAPLRKLLLQERARRSEAERNLRDWRQCRDRDLSGGRGGEGGGIIDGGGGGGGGACCGRWR